MNEPDDPDPGLLRYCPKCRDENGEAVRMHRCHQLAADEVPYYRCPQCDHTEPD